MVGADISEPLLRLAGRRARQAPAANVAFLLADAQEASLPGAPFTAAMSQFGVMFFDEPVVAFANIRRQVEPGGRLVFVCCNPWTATRGRWAMRSGPTPAASDPGRGQSPTGPFTLGDFEQTSGTLVAARLAGSAGDSVRADCHRRSISHIR